MEKKPIKRSEYLLPLSKDHHLSLLFCWKIRQGIRLGVEAERIQKYVAHFWLQHMQAHFCEEEEILFAPLRDDLVQKAIDEHRQISKQIGDLHAVSGAEIAAHAAALADLVDGHVRYEERTLFPHLEQALSTEQLMAIGKQLKEEPVLVDDFADAFWIKQKDQA